MKYPKEAIKYLEKSFIFILSCGNLIDQAKLHYLYSKCLFMLLNEENESIDDDDDDVLIPQNKTKIDINQCLNHMLQCIDKLEQIQAMIYLKEAYSFISLIYNYQSNFIERNKYAFKYRQLTKQYPFIGFLL
jgi:hypothetical protein